ncbi:helix-turn-helix transcriptional regulator [bacterium]|nr:helix-turn-helix transcriptional regulator [bacterium]
MAATIAEKLLEEHGPLFEIPPGSEVVEVLTDIYEEALSPAKPTVFRAASLLYRLLMLLCETSLRRKAEYPGSILLSLAFMDNRYGEPDLRLEDLAQSAGLSKYHFSRLFHEVTGQTPTAALRERRMQAAQELLAFTHLPPKQVARLVGLRDYCHFCRVYRRWSGKTPGQTRLGK